MSIQKLQQKAVRKGNFFLLKKIVNDSIDFQETMKNKERERVLRPIDNNIASVDIGAKTVKHSNGPKNIKYLSKEEKFLMKKNSLLHVKSADLKTFGLMNV